VIQRRSFGTAIARRCCRAMHSNASYDQPSTLYFLKRGICRHFAPQKNKAAGGV
jgi:hypothetical protein